ncbi:MAG: hypothetical protein ACI9MB_005183 [Verrucomicrobiales bacterium]
MGSAFRNERFFRGSSRRYGPDWNGTDSPTLTFEASGLFYKIRVFHDRAVAEWDGFAGGIWEFRSADKEGGEGRVKKRFEWMDENTLESLTVLHANMELCRSVQTAIGQGLSIVVDCSPRPEGMTKRLSYFAVDPGDRQASEMQDLWFASRALANG